jgi:hypothetical protein
MGKLFWLTGLTSRADWADNGYCAGLHWQPDVHAWPKVACTAFTYQLN